MPVKADGWIKRAAVERGVIEPFAGELVRDDKISYGVSSYGYDFRLGYEFKEPKISPENEVDPKNVSESSYGHFTAQSPFYIKPGAILIARSLEYFKIPKEVIGLCFGKSTYARIGLLVNITPLEPEWEGTLTFPLINTANYPIKIYPGEGIAQLVFIQGDELCQTSYAGRNGKYQNQKTITLSKV